MSIFMLTLAIAKKKSFKSSLVIDVEENEGPAGCNEMQMSQRQLM